VENGDYAAAGQISMLLMLFSLVALVAIYARSGRRMVEVG
jgi:ABC-type sulfate transport system permease component